MKVLMACAGGMSSSFVADALAKEAKQMGIQDFEIKATSDTRIKEELAKAEYSIILLAPQIKFQLSKIKALAKSYGIDVLPIEGRLYTPMGAATLLQQMKEIVQ